MNEIVCGPKRWRISSAASQAVWAFFILERARNGQLGKLASGSVISVTEEGSANAVELSSWYIENYSDVLWRITIKTEYQEQRLTNVWEGNAKCFYEVR